MNRDLTEGKAESVLWKFCLPLFGSVIFQQMYNIADSLVAGRFIGENALAYLWQYYKKAQMAGPTHKQQDKAGNPPAAPPGYG